MGKGKNNGMTGVDAARSFTHTRPEPDTAPPLRRPPQFVTGESVGEAICEALGIDYSTVQRVVLDLECGPGAGKVYVQHATTGNLLKYDWKAFCDGADVKIV